jgi:hypothetical protein
MLGWDRGRRRREEQCLGDSLRDTGERVEVHYGVEKIGTVEREETGRGESPRERENSVHPQT